MTATETLIDELPAIHRLFVRPGTGAYAGLGFVPLQRRCRVILWLPSEDVPEVHDCVSVEEARDKWRELEARLAAGGYSRV